MKLGAGLILLATIAVIVPDSRSLYSYFCLHRLSAPSGVWVPPAGRHSFKVATRIVEIGFVSLVLYTIVPGAYQAAKREHDQVLRPNALTGEWRVESDVLNAKTGSIDMPILTAEGVPLTALYLEPDGRAMARSMDGRLWRSDVQVDQRRHSFILSSGWFDGTPLQGRYTFAQPDDSHLVLTPAGADGNTHGVLSLSRVSLPERYPLLERRFHWANEWALEG